eukprot:GHVH01005056.1.p1 GENE.GHVH01005056.1~~GHVH01005056.1.p1  ORF type:complete len:413 (+),score=42.55 GHVH01005056.1:58-1239(+)
MVRHGRDLKWWKQIVTCLYSPDYKRRLGIKSSHLSSEENNPWLVPYRLWPPVAKIPKTTTWSTLSSKNSIVIIGISTFIPKTYGFNRRQRLINRRMGLCIDCHNSEGYFTETLRTGVLMSSPDCTELVDPLYNDDLSAISWGNTSINEYFDEIVLQTNVDLSPLESCWDILNPKLWIRTQLSQKQNELNKMSNSLLCHECLRNRIAEEKLIKASDLKREIFEDLDILSFINEDEEINPSKNVVQLINKRRGISAPKKKEPIIAVSSAVMPKNAKSIIRNFIDTINRLSEFTIPAMLLLYFTYSIVISMRHIIVNFLSDVSYLHELKIRPVCSVDDVSWLISNPSSTIIDYEIDRKMCLGFTQTATNPEDPSNPSNLCARQGNCSYQFPEMKIY